MKELSLEERKKISLDILIYIDSICKKYQLTYYLAYGTLLGAVRHQGFIPWDDDIDIWMPVDSLDKFLNILERLECSPKYALINHKKEKYWNGTFSKLYDVSTLIQDVNTSVTISKFPRRGVAVDIFPLFYLKDKKSARKIVNLQRFRNRMLSDECGAYGKDIRHLLCVFLKKLNFNINYFQNQLEEFQKYGKSQWRGCPISPYDFKDIHSADDFQESILLFEGIEFIVPKGYNNILTNLYGKYMALPPVEKRISNHNVKAFAVNE